MPSNSLPAHKFSYAESDCGSNIENATSWLNEYLCMVVSRNEEAIRITDSEKVPNVRALKFGGYIRTRSSTDRYR
jgi:hypothetical protein